MIVEALAKARSGRHLSEAEAFAAFSEIMSGEAVGEAVLAALLTAIEMNAPSAAEVTGAARAMRAACVKVKAPAGAVDIVGTGGDGHGTFNVSTVAAFVAAGAGVTVAKHGNKASTSKSGSADCLAALGYDLATPVAEVERSLRENGIGFLFANMCHPAMKYAAPVRRALPFRTIFNLVGPLANPADVCRHALGVYAPEIIPLYIAALKAFGAERALVFCGPDGLDELGLSGKSHVVELCASGETREYDFDPKAAFGAERPAEALRGGDPERNAQIALDILSGSEHGARRDVAALNAAAAIVAGGAATTLEEGIALAYKSIDSGAALGKLRALTGRAK